MVVSSANIQTDGKCSEGSRFFVARRRRNKNQGLSLPSHLVLTERFHSYELVLYLLSLLNPCSDFVVFCYCGLK